MTKYSYAETVKVLPLLASVDIGATATNSKWIDLDQAAGLLEIELNFGAITSTDSTGDVTVTVLASTAGSSSDTNTALAFEYRLSEAVDTDSMGAITAATTAGVALESSSDDNKTLLIYVDPCAVQAAVTDGRYIGVLLTPAAETSVCLVGVVARYTPRYASASMPSST